MLIDVIFLIVDGVLLGIATLGTLSPKTGIRISIGKMRQFGSHLSSEQMQFYRDVLEQKVQSSEATVREANHFCPEYSRTNRLAARALSGVLFLVLTFSFFTHLTIVLG